MEDGAHPRAFSEVDAMTPAFRWIRRLGLALAACTAGSLAAPALAQALPVPANAGEAIDPPGRVARLADVSGSVWLLNPETGEWTAALRNQPLTTGDRLATDAGGRAELRVGSTSLRMDGGGELEVLRLDDDHIDLQLHQGSLAARLRSAEALREFELHTAEGRFVAHRTGRYRLDRRGESSALTVYGGEALYEGPGSALTVYSNQRADFRLDRTGNAQYAISEPLRDDFALWTADRDRADDRASARDVRPGEPIGDRLASSRYVSPEMTGAEDLDRNGSWDNDPEYGALWVPRAVPVGWAPYSAGRWAWVRPWGWTWIDEQPWGFAPFHYGRWVNRRNVWCWAPGSYVARPVYAPALVGWVGAQRPGVSISVTIGSPGPAVGWFPLAPREVFVPGYRVSPRYVREVNVTHVTNITNITTIINNPQGAVSGIDYRNRRDPRAVTTVPQAVFAQRQPVAGAAANWRREVGERGQRELIAAPVIAAPPAFERGGLPAGTRPESGRPAWPRGAPLRTEAPAPGVPMRAAEPLAAPPGAVLPTAPSPRLGAGRDAGRDVGREFGRDAGREDRRDDRRDARPPAAPLPGAAPAVAPPAPARPLPAATPPAPVQPTFRGNPNGRPQQEVEQQREQAREPRPLPQPSRPREVVPEAAPSQRPAAPPSAEPRRETPRERAPERAPERPAEKPAARPVERAAPRAPEAAPALDERRGPGGQGGGERRERGDRVERNQAN